MVRGRVLVLVVLLLVGTIVTVLVYQLTDSSQSRTRLLPSYTRKDGDGRDEDEQDGGRDHSHKDRAWEGLGRANHSDHGEVLTLPPYRQPLLPKDIKQQVENNLQEAQRLRQERRRLDGEYFQLKQEKRKLEGERRKLEEKKKALSLQRQLLEEDRKQLAAERIFSRRKAQEGLLKQSSGRKAQEGPVKQSSGRKAQEGPVKQSSGRKAQEGPVKQSSGSSQAKPATDNDDPGRQLSIDSSRRLRVQGQEPLRQAPKYQTKGKPHKLYRNPLSVQGANLQLYLNKMFKTQPMFRLSPTKPSEVKHSQRQRSAFSTLTPRAAGNNVGSVLHSNEPQDKVVGVSPSNLTLDGHNEKMASYLEQGHFGYVHGTNRKNSSVMTGGQPQGGASKNQSQGHSKAKGVSDGSVAAAKPSVMRAGAMVTATDGNLAWKAPDQLWEGRDPAQIARLFPGIMLDGDYILRPFIDLTDERASGMEASPHSISDMTDGDAEERFYQLVTVDHVHCADRQRMGNFDDGGWDICISGIYRPKQNCLVYSFGINNDFSFDDAIANKYGCQVKAFDPSMTQSGYSGRSHDMNVGDHMHSSKVYFYNLGLGPVDGGNSQGWQLRTLGAILRRLKHQDRIIDYLKVDIEFNEWASFKTMLKENSLRNVKQFVFEIHTSELYNVNKPSRKENFYEWYNTLLGIEQQGFRRYNHHYNPNGQYTSVRTGKERTCCYELYYINIRFLNS